LLAYYGLGMIGLLSVFFAVLQVYGLYFWPTLSDQRSGLFYNPVVQGGFLGLLIVAMVRIGCFWMVPFLALGLYINPNRGGWVAAAIGLLATWVRKPMIIATMVMLGAFYLTQSPRLSDQERLNVWQAGWVNLTWLGHGWGSYADVWIVRDGFGFQAVHAHNDYLELVFELGIRSIPVFFLLLYALLQTSAPDWPILVAFCTLATFSMPTFLPATASIGAIAFASILIGAKDGQMESS